MSKRIASFQLMELIEQELAYAAEADLAAADHFEDANKESGDEPFRGDMPWRGIEDQMKNPMPRRGFKRVARSQN
jgi:hypothetical protein